jgi:multidrug efflux pump subunit AcrA (membrane-fusion protein)
MKRVSLKRILLPALGVVAAVWATYSIARTTPRRQATDPPSSPPASEYPDTVAAVGLVEASTENISIGTPLPGVVARVFVSAGQNVKAGDPLFELDLRQLRADLDVKQRALAVAASRVGVARAKLDDLTRQLAFVEQVKDHRAVSAEEHTRRRSAVQTATAELEQARSESAAAGAQVGAAVTEIERSTVRAPLDTQVLQIKLRVGEFAPAGPTETPLVVLGRVKPLHVRVDVDEQEAWRVRGGARAIGRVRGNAQLKTSLAFVRFEPFVTPKRSLTGDTTERVDTRVLQVIYRVEHDDVPLYVGQQLDVFIEGRPDGTPSPSPPAPAGGEGRGEGGARP